MKILSQTSLFLFTLLLKACAVAKEHNLRGEGAAATARRLDDTNLDYTITEAFNTQSCMSTATPDPGMMACNATSEHQRFVKQGAFIRGLDKINGTYFCLTAMDQKIKYKACEMDDLSSDIREKQRFDHTSAELVKSYDEPTKCIEWVPPPALSGLFLKTCDSSVNNQVFALGDDVVNENSG